MTSSCTASAVSSRSNRTNKIIAACIIILVALVSLPLESVYYWWGDNVVYGYYPYMYSYYMPATELSQVNSLSDVITANNLNYLQVNGRYVAHFFVILFCGLSNPAIFALYNALAWALFIILIMKVCRKGLTDIPSLILTSSLALYIMGHMGSGPAIQINYIWMFCLTLGWILAFNKAHKIKGAIPIIGLGLFSLIAGNSSESSNIGVMGALLVLLIQRRARFSAAEWVMGILFVAGCLADCLAPSTMTRQGSASGGTLPFQLIYYIIIKYAYFPIPLVFLLLVTVVSKGFRKTRFRDNLFYWSAFTFTFVFLLMLGIRSSNQYFGMMLFIAILTVRMVPAGHHRRILLAALALVFSVPALYAKYRQERDYTAYLTKVEKDYLASDTGLIYVDASNPLSSELFETHRDCFVLKNGQKKPIMVLPAELRDIEPGSSPNFIKEYSPSHFLVVQSKKNPAEFIYDLTFSVPGYTRQIEHSVVDFSNPYYETDDYRAVFAGGYWFMDHKLTMRETAEKQQTAHKPE